MPPLLLWLLATWLAGWCLLPVSRLLFSRLPDGGLAAGRVLWLLLAGLLALWTAVYGLAPLSFAPLWVLGVPLLGLLPLLNVQRRADFLAWLRGHGGGLKWSDAVFVGSFLAFAWVRARHPEINDLEKPMDAALMASAARAQFLPFQNCWFAGQAFTDYYYFFHLCGGLLLRTFQTPIAVGYNLVQPLVCALFWSTLWSLGASLAGTNKRGVAVVLSVALFGHFEPIRQWLTPRNPSQGEWLFRLNWWETSRVLLSSDPKKPGDFDKTINEYPAFSSAIGDAHAHFWAFPFAMLLFCLCLELFYSALSPSVRGVSRRRVLLLMCAGALAAFWAGNTWDVPVYALLVLACGVVPLWRATALRANVKQTEAAPPAAVPDAPLTKRERRLREQERKRNGETIATAPQPATPPANPQFAATRLPLRFVIAEVAWILGALLLARVLAQPYLRTFKAPVSGARMDFWLPPLSQLLLLWGGIFALLGVAFWVWKRERALRDTGWDASQNSFAITLAVCGLIAWAIPFVLYIRGVWGDGDLRHQDTVFKFGLQAWLLLGVAGASGAARLLDLVPRRAARRLVGAWAVASLIPLMCGLCVFWTRTFRDAPRESDGRVSLSLNGAKFLPQDDQDAIEWLRTQAPRDAVIVEACDPNGSGDFQGDFARASALSGVPTVYGWGQHVSGWGVDGNAAQTRHDKVLRLYAWPSDAEGLALLHDLNANYVFVGGTERRVYKPDALARLERALPDKVFQRGQTFIARVP